MNNFFKNKKVFITGHTGFKGIWLVNILKYLKADVYGYSKDDKYKKNFLKLCKLNKKKSFYGDILDKRKLLRRINQVKPQIIFHFAAQSILGQSYLSPTETININVLGTLNILETCKNSKSVKSIIIATSDKCYENLDKKKFFVENDKLGGDDPYSASKAAAEIIIKSYSKSFYNTGKIGLASVRAGNVIGGGDWSKNRLFPDCARAIINKNKLHVRNPNSVRPWQHVMDVLNGYLILSKMLYLAKNKNKFNGSWNFGPSENKNFNVKSVVKQFFKTINLNKKINYNKKKLFREKKILNLNSGKSFKFLKWKQKIKTTESIKLSSIWYLNYIKKNKNLIFQQIKESKLFD